MRRTRLLATLCVLATAGGCRGTAALAPSVSAGGPSAQQNNDGLTRASESSTEGTRASEASSKASNESSRGSAESSAASNQSSKPSSESSKPSSESTKASEPSSRASSESTEASRGTSKETSGGANVSVGLLASTATLGVTVGVIGLVVWLVNRGETPPKAGAAAQAWLRSQQRQLVQDLALGAGPSIDDLAAAAEIAPENLTQFGRVLRGNRDELLARLPSATSSPEHALALLGRVGELARRDAALRRDYERFLAVRQLER